MDKNLNYFHFLIIIHLLTYGAKENYIEITSTQISKIIKRSQQTASKILIELEKDNLIERISSYSLLNKIFSSIFCLVILLLLFVSTNPLFW